MNNIQVIFDPTFDEQAVADANAEAMARQIALNNELAIVANILVIDHLRLLRARNEINSLIIFFKDNVIECSPKGMLDWWPKGFGDEMDTVLSELIDWRRNA